MGRVHTLLEIIIINTASFCMANRRQNVDWPCHMHHLTSILTVILYIGSIIMHTYRQENRSTENLRTFPGSVSKSCRATSMASDKVNRNPADTSSRVHHKHWGWFQPHVNITKRINNHRGGKNLLICNSVFRTFDSFITTKSLEPGPDQAWSEWALTDGTRSHGWDVTPSWSSASSSVIPA